MIITVCLLKGGVGKTTTAVGLAAGLAARGERVKLLDCDPQRSASDWATRAGFAWPSYGPVGPLSLQEVADLSRDGQISLVIDTPPGHVELVRAAVGVADVVVLPVEPAGANVPPLVDTVRLVGACRPAGLDGVFVLLSRSERRSRERAELLEVLEGLGLTVLQGEAFKAVAVKRAYGGKVADVGFYQRLLAEIEEAGR
jgi:chromosome partitioning protein